jgi:hypothetical protein
VALNSGTSQRYASPHEFRHALERLNPNDVATVRVEAEIADEFQAVILVRNQIPAVLVEVAGRDGATVLGLAQRLHGRLMTGYVDPLTSLRGFVGRFSSRGLFLTAPDAAAETSSAPTKTQTSPSSSQESVQSARRPTAVVLWAHGDPEWQAHEEEDWQNTVLAFTHLLCAGAIDADLDLFHGHTATDWARFGPRAIQNSDYVLVAVSPTWRRAWDDEVEPGKSAGAVAEANTLRGLFKENRQKFLERVIPVLLPGREESDLPTELKATSHWVRVPTLDQQGTENLYRRLTRQPAYPKPPLGTPRTLPPRTPFTTAAEGKAPETEQRTRSHEDLKQQIDRTESALADMPAASPRAGEKPWDQARQSVEARRKALSRDSPIWTADRSNAWSWRTPLMLSCGPRHACAKRGACY